MAAGGHGWWSLELVAAVGNLAVGGGGRDGLGELDTVMVAVAGAAGGSVWWVAVRSGWSDGGADFSGLGGGESSISTSCAGDAGAVLVGDRASWSRRPGD